MGENLEELGAWEWIGKIVEKATFIRLSAIEHKDISEEDYEVIKFYYRQWWEGAHPLYKSCTTITDEKATQGGLFAKLSDTTQGTKVVDYEAKNLNTEE